jgi:hypothetical protein
VSCLCSTPRRKCASGTWRPQPGFGGVHDHGKLTRPLRHNRHGPRLELYLLRYRDPLTGKWVRARHKLQMPALQRQYAEWEITGAPEIRHVTPGSAEPFNPFRPPPSRACIAPMLLYMR